MVFFSPCLFAFDRRRPTLFPRPRQRSPFSTSTLPPKKTKKTKTKQPAHVQLARRALLQGLRGLVPEEGHGARGGKGEERLFFFFFFFLPSFFFSGFFFPTPFLAAPLTMKRNTTTNQKQCVTKCCEKYMKHSARTGVRFAELSSQAEQQIAQAMKK